MGDWITIVVNWSFASRELPRVAVVQDSYCASLGSCSGQVFSTSQTWSGLPWSAIVRLTQRAR
jgi:hypothetical protein